jgi:quercetin dioxygenase-like cupin family protein
MRSLAVCLSLFAVIAAALWTFHHGHTTVAAQSRPPVRVIRIFTGDDGQTHAGEIEAKLGAADALGLESSDNIAATSANFVRFRPGFFEDWHHAKTRRYVVTLTGRGEVEIGGGRKITLEPGLVLLAEDMTGHGHITRALSDNWTALFVQLEE